MKHIDYGVTWLRWMIGFEVLVGQTKADPFGAYAAVGVYVGPFYLFVRWHK